MCKDYGEFLAKYAMGLIHTLPEYHENIWHYTSMSGFDSILTIPFWKSIKRDNNYQRTEGKVSDNILKLELVKS